MKLRHFFLYILSITLLISRTYGIQLKEKKSKVFDTDLYESVLDPELCQKQLQHIIYSNDTTLQMEFLGSGIRIPRGITTGNLIDLGNYPQCLSINKEVEDITIKGKYCRINVPLNKISLQIPNVFSKGKVTHSNVLNLDKNVLRILEQIERENSVMLTKYGKDTELENPNRSFIINRKITLTVAICIPQACTTKDVLDMAKGAIDFEYNDISCRLPNDKPYVAADYIAWVILSILVILTVLSTAYDVRHTIILNKDPKELNVLLSAFSANKNIRNLVNIDSRPGTLECLDGIRTLSITWIILGHTFLRASTYTANRIDVNEWNDSLRSLWVKASPLSVDTFYLLSGILVVYTTAKKLTSTQLMKNLHLFYLNRLLRVFPLLAAIILFRVSFAHHLGDGPMWHIHANVIHTCRSFWWVTLLHLQNFITAQQRCLSESWYLAIDVQLHILSPLVLFWVLSGSKRSAWISLITSLIISLIVATVFVFLTDFTVKDYFVDYYVNILTRAPPFFVGLIYGYLLHLYRKNKFIMNKIISYLASVCAIALLPLTAYLEHLQMYTDLESAFLNNFLMTYLRTFWVIALGWLIFACVNGYAGPINWFLSLSFWKIPSRISYAMYLIHMSLMYIYYASTIQRLHFTVGLFVFDFFAFLFMTIVISFFATALIDAPFATIFKMLLDVGSKSQKSKANKN